MEVRKPDYELNDDIRVWSTYVPEEAVTEVQKILRSTWINTGKQERLFREMLCRRFDLPYCVACSSGTAALRASYAALGIGPGDEVVTTPYTFIATNTAILEQGATPVFADISYDTLNIDPTSIEQKITKETKAIVCVHYGGNPCDMAAIRRIGAEYGLPIVEDAAHALGSKYEGRFIGSTGDIITFSFQVVKIVTCGDGGVIATPHRHHYELLKKHIWYGVDRELKKNSLLDPLPDQIDILGFKYNMNDIAATLALVGLKHFETPLARRREIGKRYLREFARCSKIRPTYYPPEATPNFQIFPVHVQGREEFARFMRERGIQASVNNRRNDRYSIFGGLRDLPATERADADVILIPLHAGLTDQQVEWVIDSVLEYDGRG